MSRTVEVTQNHEALTVPTWQPVEVHGHENELLSELALFWSRQSDADRYLRFLTRRLTVSDILDRYRYTFRYTQFALALHHGGLLVGFFVACVDPKKPGWYETSVEIDQIWRGHGLCGTAHEILYAKALAEGNKGITGIIDGQNAASLAAMTKFMRDKPHLIEWDDNTATFYVGPGADSKFSLDLID